MNNKVEGFMIKPEIVGMLELANKREFKEAYFMIKAIANGERVTREGLSKKLSVLHALATIVYNNEANIEKEELC